LVQPLIGTRWCIYIPGLYYIFGRAEIQAGKSEEENPLTEEIDNNEVHKKIILR
jgi:HAE1 family hydrophobic/amphiphilic exporter-1